MAIKEIPIIINNFNRLECLKKLIDCLEKRGYKNIIILDNASSYPPLLEFYRNCNYRIIRLPKNYGAYSLWKSKLVRLFNKNFFVYTDPDLEIIDECPDNFLEVLLEVLNKHKFASKVGLSLKLDDIPDCYALKDSVISHEKQFSRFFNEEKGMYFAPVDTTFALYRPGASWKHSNYNIEMYRMAYPYMARHLPWYYDSTKPDEETIYYLKSADKSATWIKKDKMMFPVEAE